MSVTVHCKGKKHHPFAVKRKPWGTFYLFNVENGYVRVSVKSIDVDVVRVRVQDCMPSIPKQVFVRDVEIQERNRSKTYRIPAKPPSIIRTYVLNKMNPYLTYYAPFGGSFGKVSSYHMKYLPYAGFNVNHVFLDEIIVAEKGVKTPIGIIQPTFYPYQTNPDSFRKVKQTHTYFVGVDIADTDRLSEYAVNLANKLSLLIVPSEASKKTYITSGVTSPVAVVAHGVSEEYNTRKKPLFPELPDTPIKVLFFFPHSPLRKGADVAYTVMRKILKERKDVGFVLKMGDTNNELSKLPRTRTVTPWLNEADLVKLYDSCQILLAPSRGGGFEMSVLEALTRGLVVLTSKWPPIMEYAKTALIIKNKGKAKPLPHNPIHIGYGANPDPENAYHLMNYAIDNLTTLKRKTRRNQRFYRENYSWKKTAEILAKALEGLD